MSYSRWSNSIWYTYADVNGGFTVCGEKHFTDEEMNDIDNCIQWFRDQAGKIGYDELLGQEVVGITYTEDELSELRGYMERYIQDRKVNKWGN